MTTICRRDGPGPSLRTDPYPTVKSVICTLS